MSETYQPCPACDHERLIDRYGDLAPHNVWNPVVFEMLPCPGSGSRWDILVDDAD